MFSCFVSQTDVYLDNLSQQPLFVLGEEQHNGAGRITRGMGGAGLREDQFVSPPVPSSSSVSTHPHVPAVQLAGVNVSIYGSLYCKVKNFENSDFYFFCSIKAI